MGTKLYIDPQRYFSDCFKLTLAVLSSGFVPDIVCSVVRGGSTPANVFSDVLKSLGIPSKFVCVFMRSYNKAQRDGYVKIEGYTLQPEHFWPGCKILGLDDVFDSGTSQGVFVADIQDRNPSIPLENIRFGVLDYKQIEGYSPPDPVRFKRLYDLENPGIVHELPNLLKTPSYYVNTYPIKTPDENPWLWYPHETEDHSIDELREKMGDDIGDIVEQIRTLSLAKK
jgi:hypoxanthine phosphoribosyltransferase